MNLESGFELDDVRGIVRRRAKLAVGIAGFVALAAYWLAMALPNEYESYATVLVEPQAVASNLVEPGLRGVDLTERLGIMTAQILSRGRLSRIIDDVDLYKQEHETMLREQIIDLMRDHIRVEPVVPELEQGAMRRGDENINQFRIYFSNRDPKIARQVAQRLANDFIERHIDQRVDTSQKSVEFIESELERLANRIEEVEARVASVKAANPGRLPEDMATNQVRLQRLNTDMALAQRQLASAHSDEAFYRSQAAAAASMGSGDDASPARRLEILELALSDYQARGFTEKHPDMMKTKVEIAAIRQRLSEMEASGQESFSAQTFAQQSHRAEAERAARRVLAAQEEVERIQNSIDGVEGLLAQTPAVAEQLDALEREYRHLFNSYQDFSRRHQEAAVQAQLERRQLGEQFRVLEAAFEAPEPSSPNRLLIVVIGALFGIVLGGGLAVVLEGADSSVHSARQLQMSSGLPVLASIPEIYLEVDEAALRRRRARQILATAALVAFALVGGFANYAWVNGLAGEDREKVERDAETPPRPAPAPGEAG